MRPPTMILFATCALALPMVALCETDPLRYLLVSSAEDVGTRRMAAVSIPRSSWPQTARVSVVSPPPMGAYHYYGSTPITRSSTRYRSTHYPSSSFRGASIMTSAASSLYPKVSRKRDVVVFNSPEANYQYETGAATTSSASSSSPPKSMSQIIKEQKQKKQKDKGEEAKLTSKDLAEATEALTENRIKLASKSLYSYKVIKPRHASPATFFIKRKENSPPSQSVSSVGGIVKTRPTFVSSPSSSSSFPSSASSTSSAFGVVPVRRPPPPRPPPVSYQPIPVAAYPKPVYQQRPRPSYPVIPPHSSSVAHSARAASYGVSLSPSYSRYPSSLTANTLVHRSPPPTLSASIPNVNSIKHSPPAPSPTYSSIVRSRASKGNTKVVRPTFASSQEEKAIVQRVKPGAASSSLRSLKKKQKKASLAKEEAPSMAHLKTLIGIAKLSSLPDKRKTGNANKARGKKKQPTVIKPFSTSHFKPIDSLRDFVGNGFSSGSAIAVSSSEEEDKDVRIILSEEDDDDDDVYAGLKHLGGSSEEDYEDNTRDVRYDYMYEVSNKNNTFGHSRIESREGDKIRGQYKVQLPDGRTQVVNYTADENGFHPTITYEGEAVEPAEGGGRDGEEEEQAKDRDEPYSDSNAKKS